MNQYNRKYANYLAGKMGEAKQALQAVLSVKNSKGVTAGAMTIDLVNKSRAQAFIPVQTAVKTMQDLIAEIVDLHDEEFDKYLNAPEAWQYTEKYERIYEAAEELDNAAKAIDITGTLASMTEEIDDVIMYLHNAVAA